MSLAQSIRDLNACLMQARQNGITVLDISKNANLNDFKQLQKAQIIQNIKVLMRKLAEDAPEELTPVISRLGNARDITTVSLILDKIANSAVEAKKSSYELSRKVPSAIRDALLADLREVQLCLNAGANRSSVILCGRMLETALHRKYYDVTGNDLLEKSPGIGLGNIVAKLSEKNISTDPGLGNQIHLINQVRIHAVHQKQNDFTPSNAQAQAILLYTLDVIEKLFK